MTTLDRVRPHIFRSHTRNEVLAAIARGQQAWVLDTDARGADDVLLGTRDEVVADVLAHHGLDALPETWSLEEVTL